MARKSPATRAAERDTVVGRAGNYMAPVDTAGMSAEDKASLHIGQKKLKPKKMGLIERIKAKMGIKY